MASTPAEREARRVKREARREYNYRVYGTNLPSQEQKQAAVSAQRDAARFKAASDAGYSPPTPAASGGLLTARKDLFARMQGAGASEAAKMREEARNLGVTSAGFNQALGRVGPAPTAPPAPPALGAPPAPPAPPALGAPPAPPALGAPPTAGVSSATQSSTVDLMKSSRRPELVGAYTTADRASLLAKDSTADVGGTEMDRSRALVINEIRQMSEGGTSMTRGRALDEINKRRVAEGRAPMKIDWKDVAALDKQEADSLRETARNKAGTDAAAPTTPKPKSADAITAERLREEAKMKESKKEEPTLADLLALSDAATKRYEDSKKPKGSPTTNGATTNTDRTLKGDLIAGGVFLGRKVQDARDATDAGAAALARGTEDVARAADRKFTDASNYLFRDPGQRKFLTAEELRSARLKVEADERRNARRKVESTTR